ncbi:retrotransposon protein [Striga asiatica]|uniref:Retrotransposon protein n=1 Tax=Striga asiatica TaxID=4170 RepID=A0A5A7PNC4_STRAF|nr:retrotransposon protein [Striga asiatica]
MLGHQFAWANNTGNEGFIDDKIYKILASFKWLVENQNVVIQNLFRSALTIDYHYLLLILVRVGKLMTRTTMFQVMEKVKETRVALIKWSSHFRAEQDKEKNRITMELKDLSTKGNSRNWLNGDREERWEADVDIERGVSSFYGTLFTYEWISEGEDLLQLIPNSITPEPNLEIVVLVEENEIKEALFSIDQNKAPRQEKCIDLCVGDSQAAFILGRQLLDNVTIAQ